MEPTGDSILNYTPAELWASIDSDDPDCQAFNSRPERQPFLARVRKIPQSERDALQKMWNFEYESRDDGGRGLSVLDHLWGVWLMQEHGNSDSNRIATAMNMSLNYVEALKRALSQPA